MPRPDIPLRSLHVHLASKPNPAPGELLRRLESLQRHELRQGTPFGGELYVRRTDSRTPEWLGFLQSGVTDLEGILSRSMSAVLIVRARRRTFLLTFGHGWALLEQTALEGDFGIKVALNTITPSSMRSVDANTVEELTRLSRVQTSRASYLDAFGFDIDRDVLRAVTGSPLDPSLGTILTGRDGTVGLHARLRFDDLGDLCGILFRQYRATGYREEFPWFDHLKRVQDAAMLEQLDSEVVAQLQQPASNVHAAPPDVLDWVESGLFRLPPLGRRTFSDIPLAEYVAERIRSGDLSVERIKADRVVAIRRDDEQEGHSWPLYRCLVTEIRHGEIHYVLSNGSWFAAEANFVRRIAKQVDTIPEVNLRFPKAKSGEQEGPYNLRVKSPGSRAILDQKLVACNGPKTRIEACDVFTRTRQFVHVKRRGSSGVLSHLFAQGRNAAQAFLEDEVFRKNFRKRVKELDRSLASLAPLKSPIARDYKVVFAVIDERSGPIGSALPFLSKITLAQTSRWLSRSGFKVFLARIAVEDVP